MGANLLQSPGKIECFVVKLRHVYSLFYEFVDGPSRDRSGPDVMTGKPVEVRSGSKGLVLVFLSAKCPCSNSHVGNLQEMAKEFSDFNFVGAHANTNESAELTREYFKTVNLGFPVIRDSKAKLADLYRASKTPHAFVINPEGQILYRGGVTDSKDCARSDRNFLREALVDLKADRKIRTPEARTLGCAISRGGKYDW